MSFTKKKDAELGPFTASVILKMTGNAAFPEPDPTLAELGALDEAFGEALANLGRGPEMTAIKDQKREALLMALRQEALYVQQNCGNDLAVLLSSGFEAQSTNRTSTELEPPTILRIENRMSTQLALRVVPVPNARSYEVRYRNGTPEWLPGGVLLRPGR